jgi:hypothetical protein
LHGFRQTFREYLLSTALAIAKEPTDAQFDPHRDPFPWQITQPLRLATDLGPAVAINFGPPVAVR